MSIDAPGRFLLGWAVLFGMAPWTLAAQAPAEMVLIPAGEFIMGTDAVDEEQQALAFGLPNPWYEDEHPLRKVTLPSFYIDRFETTHADYAKFIATTDRPAPPDWIDRQYVPQRATFPVAHVSWYDARDYCFWRAKRLPTEAEWEKAARGTDGRLYPWGNGFDPDRANIATKANLFGSSVAVGSYESGKSPYGVYDMIGNVWEWTDSWYEPYPGNTAASEPFGKRHRVNRGVSFIALGHYPPKIYLGVASVVARASFRSYDVPEAKLLDVGFRCARSAD